ncbi:hypothetical protein D9613_008849 [Agrocybe pediades]|uniref:Myb/SANT-like domain-containing protein n=1 Tax=Agrocybe pediades TaxID=84607 RepID=A0A8H4QSX0_9AGAR|nr:hypothetical protein D9613_008849 [Agrocybe pediades]
MAKTRGSARNTSSQAQPPVEDLALTATTAIPGPTHPAPSEAASWSTSDEKKLIDVLIEHKAAAGDGCSFKAATFTAAEVALAALPLAKGGPKTAASCSNKWNALRRTFRVIQAIKSKSGWSWSDDHGASISPDMEAAWCDFLKVHPAAKPFKNKGWVHLSKMEELMPSTVKGMHVFRPSEGISGMDTGDLTLPSEDEAPSMDAGVADDDVDQNPLVRPPDALQETPDNFSTYQAQSCHGPL